MLIVLTTALAGACSSAGLEPDAPAGVSDADAGLPDARLGPDSVPEAAVPEAADSTCTDVPRTDALPDREPADGLPADTTSDRTGPDGRPGVDADLGDSTGTACLCYPPMVSSTVNNIPADMNGSEPYLGNDGQLHMFKLTVPTASFVWNLDIDCPCGCVESGVGAHMAGPTAPPYAPDLFPLFEPDGEVDGAAGRWSLHVDASLGLGPADSLALLAKVQDVCGQEFNGSQLIVAVAEMTPLLHPFDLADPWLLTWHRDHYTISWEFDEDGKAVVLSADEPNGVPDFLEDLQLIGLGTGSPAPAFAAVDGNESVARQVMERTRGKMYGMFLRNEDGSPAPGAVNIIFHLEGEDGAPLPEDFAYQYLTGAETEKAFSMLGLGGGDLSKSWIGYSETLDVNNRQNENNAQKQYGMFTTSLMRFVLKFMYEDEELLLLAQVALSGILPAFGGAAIGTLDVDAQVVDPAVPDDALPADAQVRRAQYETAVELLAAGLAALAAHEIGHSLGLVPQGSPPHGLFGGEQLASFVVSAKGSTGPHIDTAGPNLMAAGPGSGNLEVMDSSYLTQAAFFNELNLAYLQGRIVVLPAE